MVLVNETGIRRVFSMRDAIEADCEAYRMFSSDEITVPLRTQIEAAGAGGVFCFMPAYSERLGIASVKTVNIFPGNVKFGITTLPSMVMTFDGETGVPSALLDGACITSLRTGAASGAALDLFGRKEAKVGALFGTGSQAKDQLCGMLEVRRLDRVYVYSRKKESREKFAEEMKEELGRELATCGTELVPAETPEEAVRDADLIITVTSSHSPVFDGSLVKPGATVSCIGAYRPEMREIDDALLRRASKIYCDSVDAVLEEAGDLITPLAEGTIRREDITGDIGDCLLGKLPGRETEEEIIVFDSVGIGAQDLVTAYRVLERAKSAGVGQVWSVRQAPGREEK